MALFIRIILLLGLLIFNTSGRSLDSRGLIVIMISGYRWDYPNLHHESNSFSQLANMGVRAEYLEPVFPTLTYPNLYSFATGKYPEKHGITGDMMFDPHHDKVFSSVPFQNATDPIWWNEAEPIWITATKSGKRVSMYRWPGCEVRFDVSVQGCSSYTGLSGIGGLRSDLRKATNDLKSGEIDLAMVYVDSVTQTTEQYGTRSHEGHIAVSHIEMALKEFLDNFMREGLSDKVNVMVLSDHGMADTDQQKLVKMYYYLKQVENHIEWTLSNGAFVGIVPTRGNEEKVFQAVTGIAGVTAYRKEEIPEKYRIKHSFRTPPIVLIANEGYHIQMFSIGNDYDSANKAACGYDPERVHDMRGIFYAFGPAFKRGYSGGSAKIVDLYNVVTRILDIRDSENDGDQAAIQSYFSTGEDIYDSGSTYDTRYHPTHPPIYPVTEGPRYHPTHPPATQYPWYDVTHPPFYPVTEDPRYHQTHPPFYPVTEDPRYHQTPAPGPQYPWYDVTQAPWYPATQGPIRHDPTPGWTYGSEHDVTHENTHSASVTHGPSQELTPDGTETDDFWSVDDVFSNTDSEKVTTTLTPVVFAESDADSSHQFHRPAAETASGHTLPPHIQSRVPETPPEYGSETQIQSPSRSTEDIRHDFNAEDNSVSRTQPSGAGTENVQPEVPRVQVDETPIEAEKPIMAVEPEEPAPSPAIPKETETVKPPEPAATEDKSGSVIVNSSSCLLLLVMFSSRLL